MALAAAILACPVAPWAGAVLFAVLAWEATGGVFGTGSLQAQQFLMLRLGQPPRQGVYAAAGMFVYGSAFSLGAAAGGWALDGLRVLGWSDPYALYFGGIASLLLGLAVAPTGAGKS